MKYLSIKSIVATLALVMFASASSFADVPLQIKNMKREITQLLAQAAQHGSTGKRGLARTEVGAAKKKLEDLKAQHEDPAFVAEQEDSIKDVEELLG
ncbi:hypothetical protein [Candidatus Nucleicultrix amoebiphila]|jgi:hypothetical protein|uniref:Uncharacterized protein n=1 Tax=Candidatus Nucleicultrix amoebiphila FS5 TaxID=1414854 RepID=A0A1W6N4I0_9PROT|nr:hypothetical protein [Candidatus Nucleicultrix amoebiphila]ARN84797.1 hypothetical protein GQ61_05285 [Candidatus Nucleicultrix amoebiphila FS5]